MRIELLWVRAPDLGVVVHGRAIDGDSCALGNHVRRALENDGLFDDAPFVGYACGSEKAKRFVLIPV